MSEFDALIELIGPIAERMRSLQRQAAQRQYKPVVDDILNAGCRDADRTS